MTDMALGAVLPELVLLGGSVIVLLFALVAPRRHQRWCALLAAVTLGLTIAATLPLFAGARGLVFGSTYAVDGVALLGKLVILGGGGIVVLLSLAWFAGDQRQGEYYMLLLMSVLGAVLLAGAADLMELVLAMLLSSVTGYVLAAFHRRSRRAGEAAIKYYLLGALTNGALVYGVVLLFGLGATTVYRGLASSLASAHAVPLVAGVALVLVGLTFKMGAVPAYAWMPDVADGAPAPAAAFLTAIPKVGALIALARLALVLPEGTSAWRPLVAMVAALTMTLGNAAALWQDDVRRLLGWSAVSQTGYALMAVVALGRSELATASLLYFLGAYTVANLGSFAVVIALRGAADRASYAALARRHPVLALALVMSFLSFVGIPPLAGFPAKLALFGATIDAGYGWLAGVAAANTAVSLAYYARVIGPMYFGGAPPGEDGAAEQDNGTATTTLETFGGPWPRAIAAGTALALIAGGIGAGPLFALMRDARIAP